MYRNQKGFTLIELLVVIAIIGLLSTIAITSLNSARVKARDARRKSDLEQVLLAFEQYYADSGNYLVSGTGYDGSGTGWFNYQDNGHYVKSIANGLKELGYFSELPLDPQISSAAQPQSGTARQYMVYRVGTAGICIYAHLENPSAEDSAAYTSLKTAGCPNRDSYTMNYAVGHQ